jgi:hypothetical protein
MNSLPSFLPAFPIRKIIFSSFLLVIVLTFEPFFLSFNTEMGLFLSSTPHIDPFIRRVLEKQLPILRKTTPRPSGSRNYCFLTSRRPVEDVKMLRQSFGSRFPNSVMKFGSQWDDLRNIQKKIILWR